jgi:hypothetical protein
MTMHIIIVAILAVLLACAPAIGGAVEMPKVLRGVWCSANAMTKKQIYIRCREADGEDFLGVDARKFFPREETVCTPLAVTSYSGGFLVRAHCDGQPDGVWNGRILSQWRLFKGGRRLEIWP